MSDRRPPICPSCKGAGIVADVECGSCDGLGYLTDLAESRLAQTTDRPPSDAAYWLYEYQKAIVNVRGLVSRGQSESAVKIIDEQIARWQRACIAFPHSKGDAYGR